MLIMAAAKSVPMKGEGHDAHRSPDDREPSDGQSKGSVKRLSDRASKLRIVLNVPSPEPKLGQIFTRRWVAETLLDLAGYTISRPLEVMTVVEPAAGEGAFLAPILQRLLDRTLGRGVPLESLSDAVRAYELDPHKVLLSRQLCVEALELAGMDLEAAEEMARQWVRQEDYLLAAESAPVDIVVGNPPYIRYDDMKPGQFALYQTKWKTLAGRGDIYVGFWEKSLSSLKPGGRVAFICADRWMRNTYGSRLRELVGERYGVRVVWSMHDVDAFHCRVSSYPAITVIANEPQGPVAVAETTAEFGARSAEELTRWSHGHGRRKAGPGYRADRLSHWYTGRGLWPTGSPEGLAVLDSLSELPTIEESGVTVGIGLASGADASYVVNTAPVEPDRLLPMATRLSIRPDGLQWAGEHLVNPWSPDGSLVSLADYPRLDRYLSNSVGVALRHVAKKNPDRWYRTIDRVIPGLAERHKLLIPDMRSQVQPYLDEQGLYPHHSFYWMTSDTWDLRVLGGLLLSDIAQGFVEAYCVRMRGGTLRLQAQYLRTIRLPHLDSIAPEVANALSSAFDRRDRNKASAAARVAYGLESERQLAS